MRSINISLATSATVLLSVLAGGAIAPSARATDANPSQQPPIVVEKTVNNGQASGSGTSGTLSPVGQDQQKSGYCGTGKRNAQPVNSPGTYTADGNDGSDSASNSGCNSFNQTSNQSMNPEQKQKMSNWMQSNTNASSEAVSNFASSIGVTLSNDSASWASANNSQALKVLTGGASADATGGKVNFAPSTTVVSKDDNRVFAPNLAQNSAVVIPGTDRYILRDDCDNIQADLTVSPVLKSRKGGFAIFGVAISADGSVQKFEDAQRGIQEQVITMLHASLMRSAERGSSYSFTRSSIQMSLESAKRSGLSIDISATMADLDAQFMSKPNAWKQARNEAIANRNSLCKPTTPPGREVPPPSTPPAFNPPPSLSQACFTGGLSGRGLVRTWNPAIAGPLSEWGDNTGFPTCKAG